MVICTGSLYGAPIQNRVLHLIRVTSLHKYKICTISSIIVIKIFKNFSLCLTESIFKTLNIDLTGV